MAETQASSIFQEWAKRYAPGLYKAPVIETPTTFPIGPSLSMPASATPASQVPSSNEDGFQNWYKEQAAKTGINPNPDNPEHRYDYRAAYAAGAAPNAEGHWPSQFKAPDHPNRFVNGIDTITGQPTSPETPTPEGTSWSDKLTKGLQDPAKMGLLTAGLSMMATPPRRVPYSNTEILGQAGLAGVGAYEKALEAKRKDELMKQTAEEHTLAREDRRTSAEERASYYRDRATTAKMEAESRNEARKATAKENAALDVPIDPAVAAHYGVDPKMTVRTFNKMQAGLTAMAKPEKETKPPDRYQNWRETFKAEKGRYPNAQEEERFGKTDTAGSEGPGKTAAIALINKELVSQYLSAARDEISKKAPPGSERMRQMVESLNTQDPTTGGPNEAKVREHLSPKQREEFDFVKRKAQGYSRTMVPAVAVQKARDDWNAKHPAPKAETKYEEYRRVYEEIRNYPEWSNAEKNAKIKEMNDKARKMGLIK